MIFATVIMILCVVCSASSLNAGPPSIADSAKSDEHWMWIEQNSKFMSGVSGNKTWRLSFCDTGDIPVISGQRQETQSVSVTDFMMGEWRDGHNRFHIILPTNFENAVGLEHRSLNQDELWADTDLRLTGFAGILPFPAGVMIS